MHDRPPPLGWPRIASAVFYDDAAAAIDWLVRAFGFEMRMRVDDEEGRVLHSQLGFGTGVVMVGQAALPGGDPHTRARTSPRSAGGANTQSLVVCVDDVDAHHARAVEAGADVLVPPATQDYGPQFWADRTYLARDPEGHQWWFLQRVREAPAPGTEEIPDDAKD